MLIDMPVYICLRWHIPLYSARNDSVGQEHLDKVTILVLCLRCGVSSDGKDH